MNCPIPGKKLEVNIPSERATFSGSMPPNIIRDQVTDSSEVPEGEMLQGYNDSTAVVQETFSHGYMPHLSTSPRKLFLTNYGENLCFSNSVVQLLTQTELRTFLLTKLPTQPNPTLTVAHELARIYNVEGEDTTAKLRRYYLIL